VGRNSYTTKIPTSRSWEAAPLSQRFPACPCSFCWLVSTLCSFRRLSSLTPPPLRRCLFRYSPPVCWSPPLLVAPQGRPYHPPHILFQSPSRHVIVSEWIHTKSWRAEAPSAKASEKKTPPAQVSAERTQQEQFSASKRANRTTPEPYRRKWCSGEQLRWHSATTLELMALRKVFLSRGIQG
jgi:hypothetical protein